QDGLAHGRIAEGTAPVGIAGRIPHVGIGGGQVGRHEARVEIAAVAVAVVLGLHAEIQEGVLVGLEADVGRQGAAGTVAVVVLAT
ncbi:hypothetical protein DF186_19775, partial [Enterococcus hirae]